MKKPFKILTVAALACLLAGALIYSGCNKMELYEGSISSEFIAEAPSYTNPYDWIGIDHNNAMDAVAAVPGFETMSFED